MATIVTVSIAADDFSSLLELVAELASKPVQDDSICHSGLVPKEECGRCSVILKARAVLEKIGSKR